LYLHDALPICGARHRDRDDQRLEPAERRHAAGCGRMGQGCAGSDGGVNPPITSASRSAHSIDVASSHIGATIWIPTGRPALVWPTGATVAGNPASVAGAIQNGIAST